MKSLTAVRRGAAGVAAALLCCGALASAKPAAPAATARLEEGQACIPAWPEQAIGRGQAGTTSLLLRVSPAGDVVSATVKKSSGFADLDQATIDTATKCRFVPGNRSGRPALSTVVFTHVWERAGTVRNRDKPVSASSRPAARKPCARLAYPADSQRNGEQGTVHMSFLIDVDGTVLEKNVVKSSGFPDLDQATLDGIGACQFSPAVTNGKPERSLLPFSYTWTLN